MVTDDLTQTAARLRPRPYRPNPSLVIFQNGGDSTGNVLLEMAMLPTQEAYGRADPEGSVRRTKQGEDSSAGQTYVRRRRPRLEANAVESHQSRIGPNPNVAVCCLCDRVGR